MNCPWQQRRGGVDRFIPFAKDSFRIVNLHETWLTGFEAPCLQAVYADISAIDIRRILADIIAKDPIVAMPIDAVKDDTSESGLRHYGSQSSSGSFASTWSLETPRA
jgi:hypothetical protein